MQDLFCSACGRIPPFTSRHTRVVGGEYALDHEFPWIVSIGLDVEHEEFADIVGGIQGIPQIIECQDLFNLNLTIKVFFSSLISMRPGVGPPLSQIAMSSQQLIVSCPLNVNQSSI